VAPGLEKTPPGAYNACAMLKSLNLAIVDVETTGAHASHDRIIEVGIHRVERGRLVDSFSSLVNPGRRIPPWIQQLTGITNDEVEDAPSFDAVAPRVRRLLDGCVFVAHNARFDYGFIRQEFARLDDAFEAPCLCTVRLSRALYPRHRRHGLSSLITRFGLRCANRHRALDDAGVVWGFLKLSQRRIAPARFSRAVTQLLETPTLPPRLDPAVVDALPEGPGAYVLSDEAGVVLYVGKSLRVRARVLAHFRDDHRAALARTLRERTASVTAHRTYGELGALLAELALIRTLSPLYNRRGRARRRWTIAREAAAARGYAAIVIEDLETLADLDPGSILGVFRNRAQAKAVLEELAAEHRLCFRLCGLERGRGACARVQLKMCRGACAGRERAALYNARFTIAFAARRVASWPYAGAVVIEERDVRGAGGHRFVVGGWRLMEASAVHDGAASALPLDASGAFDYDVYGALRAYFRRGGRARPLPVASLPEEAAALAA